MIASLNAVQTGSWLDYAPTLEQAGADAVELNLYFLATHLGLPGSEIETLKPSLTLTLSSSEELWLTVRWIALLHGPPRNPP